VNQQPVCENSRYLRNVDLKWKLPGIQPLGSSVFEERETSVLEVGETSIIILTTGLL
jgi:hypothetical protein